MSTLTESTGEIPALLRRLSPQRVSAADVARLTALGQDVSEPLLHAPAGGAPSEARLKVYRTGSPLSLTTVLPLLAGMGFEVVDEQAYELAGHPWPAYVYDFGLRYPRPVPWAAREAFQDALVAVWTGLTESDGFNALVLAAGLTWRQVTVLRAIARYLRQAGSPFATEYVEETLVAHPELAGRLVALFEARFDPDSAGDRTSREERLGRELEQELEAVVSLDHDRILRSYLTLVRAMLRTNYFQADADADGAAKPALCFKLRPDAVPELPEPRPRFEIFVHSPRVEGVHLRFGPVARGGLRWSDRRDDFRTEVLGLVKAQMVKNTVIVPVGAKGGFFCKQLPPIDPTQPGDRDAWLAEGVACYRTFIAALLDVTDNLVDGTVVPPAHVVRHDGDDAYLVVAADKGTATFSDLANEVSADYGHWLGDAFASGGSHGYDHKAMGITARGAWESVKRHFRELGTDCQTTDFTCVGIGDMSGDVFGNGMLLSRHTRLVAAFDHRHVFLDPDPDPATSYSERQRLFALPRSSWQDYDPALISAGGGVFPRTAKSIPLSPEVRRALDIEAPSLTPAELIRAILQAPVDLLWNGGIGTYVKASTETHAEVGDKANDAIRIDGRELRARCVGEGGNLGLTQRGRIEYARGGGRLNTDFIDNSAGVDTSDREVNIKILLDTAIEAGELSAAERNDLLAAMTGEVAELVLRDNAQQNEALAMSALESDRQAPVHQDWMARLQARGVLDRELEHLPSAEEMAARVDAGVGLTVPELSVLLAYTKIVLAEEVLAGDLPDHPFLQGLLTRYFPRPLHDLDPRLLAEHPLRRQIIATQAVNELVNGTGTTYYHRLSEETGASAGELLLANFAAREIFGSRDVLARIGELDDVVPAAVHSQMRAEIRDLVERAARWLVYNAPGDPSASVESFAPATGRVLPVLPSLFGGRELAAFETRRHHLVASGVDDDLATRVAAMVPAYTVLTIVQVADRLDVDAVDVARLHFTLGERLGLSAIGDLIRRLPREDRWQTMARTALREDIHSVHGELTAQAFACSSPADPPAARVESWEAVTPEAVTAAADTLAEIAGLGVPDLAALSVAVRTLRHLHETLEAADA